MAWWLAIVSLRAARQARYPFKWRGAGCAISPRARFANGSKIADRRLQPKDYVFALRSGEDEKA